jgi:LPLT family lysophospholipid transporter-like MFS transporter
LLVLFYGLAAWFNTRIPNTGAALIPMRSHPEYSMARSLWILIPDFFHCNQLLWKDKLGQISLATTTLFWGVSGNLRYIVLAWSAAALGYSTTQASSLVGVVAIGTAAGAVVASMRMRLEHATRIMPLGIVMGVFLLVMIFIRDLWLAIPFLIVIGGLGGFLVVPMNALLQHRGHNLMGAGRSIAVQNLNEQLCILLLGGLYTLFTGMGMSAFGAITAFGTLVAFVMWLIKLWHESNQRHHSEELARLMLIASQDDAHG